MFLKSYSQIVLEGRCATEGHRTEPSFLLGSSFGPNPASAYLRWMLCLHADSKPSAAPHPQLWVMHSPSLLVLTGRSDADHAGRTGGRTDSGSAGGGESGSDQCTGGAGFELRNLSCGSTWMKGNDWKKQIQQIQQHPFSVIE